MPEITDDDVTKALTKAKNFKALGPGNIRMELLKYGGEKVIKYIKRIFNKIERGRQIPPK